MKPARFLLFLAAIGLFAGCPRSAQAAEPAPPKAAAAHSGTFSLRYGKDLSRRLEGQYIGIPGQRILVKIYHPDDRHGTMAEIDISKTGVRITQHSGGHSASDRPREVKVTIPAKAASLFVLPFMLLNDMDVDILSPGKTEGERLTYTLKKDAVAALQESEKENVENYSEGWNYSDLVDLSRTEIISHNPYYPRIAAYGKSGVRDVVFELSSIEFLQLDKSDETEGAKDK